MGCRGRGSCLYFADCQQYLSSIADIAGPQSDCFLSLSRYSVSVFQPPFQMGRMSPEQGLQPQPPEKQEPPAKNNCVTAVSAAAADTTTLESGDGARAPHLLPEPQASLSAPELPSESGNTSAVRSKVSTGRSSARSLDSGFSEPSVDTRTESFVEKELLYERAPKPEGK